MKIDHRTFKDFYAAPPVSLETLKPFLGEKWPEDELAHNNNCEVCLKGGEVLCCDHCNVVYHRSCTNPLPPAWKSGDAWACALCYQEALRAYQGASPEAVVALEASFQATLVDGVDVGLKPAKKGKKTKSKKQLDQRPNKRRAPPIVRLHEEQASITHHGMRRNASGRVEMMYWVVPRSQGSFQVNNGSFLTKDQVDPQVLKWYRTAMGLNKEQLATVNVLSAGRERYATPVKTAYSDLAYNRTLLQQWKNLPAAPDNDISVKYHAPRLHPHLWVGGMGAAADAGWLGEQGIKSILSLHSPTHIPKTLATAHYEEDEPILHEDLVGGRKWV